jgi:DNA (cytosine-5)-methyltransferase 1
MKYFDTFTGIGGFSLAIQQVYEERNLGIKSADKKSRQTKPKIQFGGIGTAMEERRGFLSGDGWTRPVCVGYSEIDKYACQVYEKHFNHKNYGDITKINATELPDFDLLCGGFPCQAFSIAGKRKGFEDTRGTLFFDIARIVKEKRPGYLLLENVKGLLSHDGGRTFKTILSTLTELGYDLQWQVLNSKNFGVPQNRERVFIIGHLRSLARPKVFPIRENNPKAIEQIIGGSQGYRVYDPTGGVGAKTGLYAIPDKSPTIRAEHHNTADVHFIPVLTPDRLNKRQNGRRFKEDGEPSFTLTGQDIHGISDGMRIRRLTPLECERLQGFPDNWTAEGTKGKISDSQRYKMCGNAVTVNVVEFLISKLCLE